jgi:hypothetical protein
VWLDAPHKRLTFAQILTLMEHNIVTLDYLQRWAEDQGYSQEDQQNLELLFAIKDLDFEAKQKAAAAKAAKSSGQIPPAPPSQG